MDVKKALERLTPATGRLPNWDGVLQDARPSRARWAAPRLAIVAAVLGVAALFALAPWKTGERTGVLDRALAAVGDGPVLHAVVREGWGGDVIDLKTGERTRINGEREVWYDPGRGLHSVSRFGGVHQGEELWPPGEVPRFLSKTFGLLAEGYPEALEAGRARLLGPGEVFGIPVYWIRVDAEMLPEGNQLHEWAHDVAVSRESYEPVATRETVDGKAGPDRESRVLELELLAKGEGDFTKGAPNPLDGGAFRAGGQPIELSEAASTLGHQPLWLGPEHSGLRLAQVGLSTTTVGRTQETVLQGTAAAEAKACVAKARRMHKRGEPPRPDCLRRLGSFGIREGKVYVEKGPPIWGAEHKAVQIVYSNDAVSRGPVSIFPNYEGPHVVVHQTTDPHPGFFRGATGYTPPEGSIIVFGRFANLRQNGIYVAIQASSEELLLSAARALRPLSAGSGAGE
jgi:hypothetical protein